MTNIYFLIYFNSVQSHFLLSLVSENAWFAALSFGNHNMVLATLAAFLGSTFGMAVDYGFGYYLSGWRTRVPAYSEGLYSRLSKLFNDRLYVLLAVPPILILDMIPGFTLFALVNGLFRVPPRKAIAAMALARALYYGFYLIT